MGAWTRRNDKCPAAVAANTFPHRLHPLPTRSSPARRLIGWRIPAHYLDSIRAVANTKLSNLIRSWSCLEVGSTLWWVEAEQAATSFRLQFRLRFQTIRWELRTTRKSLQQVFYLPRILGASICFLLLSCVSCGIYRYRPCQAFVRTPRVVALYYTCLRSCSSQAGIA